MGRTYAASTDGKAGRKGSGAFVRMGDIICCAGNLVKRVIHVGQQEE